MSTETVIITPLSAEDGGGFLATIPSMPGCMSDGETEAEARENVADAARAWLAVQVAYSPSTSPPSVTLPQATG
jgi:antitoxin HicB